MGHMLSLFSAQLDHSARIAFTIGDLEAFLAEAKAAGFQDTDGLDFLVFGHMGWTQAMNVRARSRDLNTTPQDRV